MENQENSIADMEVNTNGEVLQEAKVKVLKCKPGLGTLNRLTKSAQADVANMGHAAKRFKRDYANGRATYTCPNCGAQAMVEVRARKPGTSHSKQGEALSLRCSVVNS